ncbi:MAG: asparaginase domain-containing protein [Synergistes sp.]|nr:asparaginase domain-containing protein [Synergistes sp.]
MFPLPKLALVIAGHYFANDESDDPGTLLNVLPVELASLCDIKEWSTQPSTHYSVQMTIEMEAMFESLVDEGYVGIVVVSGSGVMDEIAYVVNLLWQRSEPVIFVNLMGGCVGDVENGLLNLRTAVSAALSPDFSDKGVMVASGGELLAANDVVLTDPDSPECAFQTFREESVGKMLNGEIKFIKQPKRPVFLSHIPAKLPYVPLLYTSLGSSSSLVSMVLREQNIGGIVIAGFGAGNVPPSWVLQIRNVLHSRIPVVITSRCIHSKVRKADLFEGSFGKLLEMGVMSGGKLSPVQARLRMMIGIASGLTLRGLELYLLNKPIEDTPELYR